MPRGLRYMVAGAFFFSIMSLLVKLVGTRLPSQEIVLGRSLVMVVLAYAAVRRAGANPWGRRRGLLVLRGLLGFAALSCFYYALVHLPLADATVLQYTNPAWATVIAIFVLGETLRPRELASLGLSLIGVVLVARPEFLFGAGGGLDPKAVAIGLTGAVFSGSAYVIVRLLHSEHHMVVILYFAVVSVVCSLPIALIDAVVPSPTDLALLAGVGVSTHWAQSFMTRGLHLERTGRATATSLVQIVFAGAWGLIIFADVPDAPGLLGAALVIAGVLLLARS